MPSATQPESTWRLFIGIPVPELPAMRNAMAEFAELGGPMKPTNPRQWHVTLKFLGDTSVELAPALTEAIRQAAADVAALEVRLLGVGAFPHSQRPSVVWAGLEPKTALQQMARAVESHCAALPFPEERRPFHPHLTLAYVRGRPPEALRPWMSSYAQADFGSFVVDRLQLIRSVLTPRGPVYTAVAESRL